jgi:ribonuclease HI
MNINIYILTTNRRPRADDGKYMYILEAETKEGNITKETMAAVLLQTPNETYLTALVSALARINQPSQLIIYLDSEYMTNALNNWLPVWKVNGWKTRKGRTIKNLNKWQKAAELLSKHKYKAEYSRNHSYYEWMRNEVRKENEKHST